MGGPPRSWWERIKALEPRVTFRGGATATQIEAVERAVGVTLSAELRELLAESDGVFGEYDLGLVWPAVRIERDNLRFRALPAFRGLYMPFDSLLFFADAGNGDQFAFRILEGKIPDSDVYAWDHEDDSRRWVARSLADYLERWLSGQLKL
jgi:hypothetical protein